MQRCWGRNASCGSVTERQPTGAGEGGRVGGDALTRRQLVPNIWGRGAEAQGDLCWHVWVSEYLKVINQANILLNKICLSSFVNLHNLYNMQEARFKCKIFGLIIPGWWISSWPLVLGLLPSLSTYSSTLYFERLYICMDIPDHYIQVSLSPWQTAASQLPLGSRLYTSVARLISR